MSTFRERIEPKIEEEHEPAPPQIGELESPDINPLKDAPKPEELNLDIWEGENRRKYAQDYFKIREIANEFPVKAQYVFIDKYIKAELEKRGYEKNTQNWEALIQEIEGKIGTQRLSTFKRLQRIFNYIQVVNKIDALNEKKKLYLS